jgi:bacterioferritin
MQRLNPVKVGEDPIEQHKLDLDLELDAYKRLNDAIKLCRDAGDNGTRDVLEHILREEEESIDWHETQLKLVADLGKEHYLAHHMHKHGD